MRLEEENTRSPCRRMWGLEPRLTLVCKSGQDLAWCPAPGLSSLGPGWTDRQEMIWRKRNVFDSAGKESTFRLRARTSEGGMNDN
jgi:hypothetical protein